ncbi:uncharacterized protein LOC118191204 [Stegodyphus dumicola]|uniref:uncharacterized protein LOC118191204 n=1 Tax=Stegodyphus dumicola TaxID=202533 RepID=UPI0015AC09BD|nr:uncharacterized protein LOC118191204 [Stegodyphus dumicola]
MQALLYDNTEAIKGILRQDCFADYIFASVTDGRARLSAWILFLRARAIVQEMIKLLVEKSPPHILDLLTTWGYTPLDYVCEYNSPDVVQFLLSQGSSLDSNNSL